MFEAENIASAKVPSQEHSCPKEQSGEGAVFEWNDQERVVGGEIV